MTSNQEKSPELSIGMPVYNGELFIQRAIESILAQTFTDFELIISDNNSTDATQEICEKFIKQDNRIRYFQQEENIRTHRNFIFLLKQAKGKYFAWTAVDDYLDNDYMEKNINVLASNKNIVSSVGKTVPFGADSLDINSEVIQTTKYPKFIKDHVKNSRRQKLVDTAPVSGLYEEKIRSLLKNTKSLSRFYGVNRTEQLQKCIVDKPFICVEVAIFLNLLKFGDFHEETSTTLYEFDEGVSTTGIISMAKNSEHNWFGMLFPFYPYVNWCVKNLGIKNFLKNIDVFFMLSLGGCFALIIDLILQTKK